jgi:hypothetical protein
MISIFKKYIYFLVFIAQGSLEYKTKTINNTTDPEWNEVY